MPERKPSRGESGWASGEEAEYAREGASRGELVAALSVVAFWVILEFLEDGLGEAVQAVAFYLIPLAMIWRPDVLGRAGATLDLFWKMDQPTPGKIVRVCGWLWLFFPVFVHAFAAMFRAQLK
jgi:hypothetical protein